VLGEMFSITLGSWSVGSNIWGLFWNVLNLTFTSLNFSTCHKPLMINIHTSHNITLPNIHVTISHCLWSYLEPNDHNLPNIHVTILLYLWSSLEPNDHTCPTYMSQYHIAYGHI
jgi:hypothetical protein